MTEEPTHHHMVADAVQIKLEMPAVDTKVISPEELRAAAIVQPEPWMVRHLRRGRHWNGLPHTRLAARAGRRR